MNVPPPSSEWFLSGGSTPGLRLWAGGIADWSYGNQCGEVGERVAQMLRREWRESDMLAEGVRDG